VSDPAKLVRTLTVLTIFFPVHQISLLKIWYTKKNSIDSSIKLIRIARSVFFTNNCVQDEFGSTHNSHQNNTLTMESLLLATAAWAAGISTSVLLIHQIHIFKTFLCLPILQRGCMVSNHQPRPRKSSRKKIYDYKRPRRWQLQRFLHLLFLWIHNNQAVWDSYARTVGGCLGGWCFSSWVCVEMGKNVNWRKPLDRVK